MGRIVRTLLILVFGACPPLDDRTPDTTQGAPVSGDPNRGRSLFLQHCALCHGPRGDGQGMRRAHLVGTIPDFTRRRWRDRQRSSTVSGIIRNGKPGTSMAAWRSLGTPAIADLTAHVLRLASAPDAGPPR